MMDHQLLLRGRKVNEWDEIDVVTSLTRCGQSGSTTEQKLSSATHIYKTIYIRVEKNACFVNYI